MPAQFVAVDSAGAASSNADQFTHNKKKALNRQEFMQCIVCPRPIEFSPSSRIRILIRILIRMLIRIAAGRPEALPISPAAPIPPPRSLYSTHTHTHTRTRTRYTTRSQNSLSLCPSLRQVRAAVARFVQPGLEPDVSNAVNRLFVQDLKPRADPLLFTHPNAWRPNIYTQEVDEVLRRHELALRSIYSALCALKPVTMENGGLANSLATYSNWREFTRIFNLVDLDCTERDATLCFIYAKMQTINEDVSKLALSCYLSLTASSPASPATTACLSQHLSFYVCPEPAVANHRFKEEVRSP